MNFHKLDLNLLVALDALLDERHVGRAAERLHVSQPTMSVALAKLRDHYRDELLIRDGRVMAVTPFAAGLKPALRQFVSDTRSLALAGVGFEAEKSERRFVVALSDGSARQFAPRLLRRMRAAAPSTTLSCLGVTAASVKLFNEGEADLLVVPHGAWLNDDDHSWTERQPSEPAAEEPRVCLAWIHNRTVGDPATLEQIRRAGVIIPSFVSNDSRPPAERPLARYYGAEIRVVAEMPTSAIAPSLVGSEAVALLSRGLAALETQRYDLKMLSLPPELDRRSSLHIYWHRRSVGDPAVAWLKALLREEIASHAHHPGESGAAGSR